MLMRFDNLEKVITVTRASCLAAGATQHTALQLPDKPLHIEGLLIDLSLKPSLVREDGLRFSSVGPDPEGVTKRAGPADVDVIWFRAVNSLRPLCGLRPG